MTILNALVRADHALIISDTAHQAPMVANLLMGVRHTEGFDALAQRVPQALEQAQALVVAQARVVGVTDAQMKKWLSGCELVLVGRSESRARWVCWSYTLEADGRSTAEVGGGSIAPWADSWGAQPAVRTKPELVALVADQVRHAKHDAPDAAVGGRAIVAEIMEGRILIEDAGAIAEAVS